MVEKPEVSLNELFQGLGCVEAVGLEHICNSAVEAFDHALGFRMPWTNQSVFDAGFMSNLVEGMLA